MPTKKKPSPAQLAARKKFVEMVRAKAKAKKSASKHTDTKSHNVNIKVVSGTKKKSATRQTGTSVKSKDKLRSALPPGKRTVGKGKAKHTYTERRANRSDKPGALLGIPNYKNAVRVYFKNPKYNYTTSVGSNVTEESAKSYFVNKLFNVGQYPKENLQKCIKIKFFKYLDK